MERFGALQVETITNGPFMQNCYLAVDETSQQAVVIDPGLEPERILQRIRDLKLQMVGIVNTHAHIDHMGGAAPVQKALGIPCALHAADAPLLDGLAVQAQMFGLPEVQAPTLDRTLSAGQEVDVGGLKLEVLFTPGHTPGGCCLFFRAQNVVFVGDTLFCGSIGRTDLPGGDHQTLLDSIESQLLPLPDDVVVLSGHGPATTIGTERRTNPFL